MPLTSAGTKLAITITASRVRLAPRARAALVRDAIACKVPFAPQSKATALSSSLSRRILRIRFCRWWRDAAAVLAPPAGGMVLPQKPGSQTRAASRQG
jgi:hypothetical protein